MKVGGSRGDGGCKIFLYIEFRRSLPIGRGLRRGRHGWRGLRGLLALLLPLTRRLPALFVSVCLPHALPSGPRLAVSVSRWIAANSVFFISRNQLGAHCVSVCDSLCPRLVETRAARARDRLTEPERRALSSLVFCPQALNHHVRLAPPSALRHP